jgi:hypothetical protein
VVGLQRLGPAPQRLALKAEPTGPVIALAYFNDDTCVQRFLGVVASALRQNAVVEYTGCADVLETKAGRRLVCHHCACLISSCVPRSDYYVFFYLNGYTILKG